MATNSRVTKLTGAPPAIVLHPHPDTPIRELARAAFTLGLALHIRLAPKKPTKKPRAARRAK